MRKYYEAYDDRYRQVHAHDLCWAAREPSPIVMEVIRKLEISPQAQILEIGCGEGRDAIHLLAKGYDLTATDISPEAIRFCREQDPCHEAHYQVFDCIGGELPRKFDFIYAVAVIHMLVEPEDRLAFYRSIGKHLKETGKALVCSMGDGTEARSSDIRTAFDLQSRRHGETGQELQLAGTSCCMVKWDTFLEEIRESGLKVSESGLTAVEPDFPVMMYAVLEK